jgi:hypothetical protein
MASLEKCKDFHPISAVSNEWIGGKKSSNPAIDFLLMASYN